MNLGGAARRGEVRAVPGRDDQHAPYPASYQIRVDLLGRLQPIGHAEVPARHEGFHELPAAWGAILVDHRDPDVVDVPGDRVAEEEQEEDREHEREDHAARVAAELDPLLPGDREKANRIEHTPTR